MNTFELEKLEGRAEKEEKGSGECRLASDRTTEGRNPKNFFYFRPSNYGGGAKGARMWSN